MLRPANPAQALLQLEALQAVGLRHVELAVSATDSWVAMVRRLRRAFPALRLGAASVRCQADLDAAVAGGLGYAVSPILDRALWQASVARPITLVPGVFTPTEVHRAMAWGAQLVKLFPAAALAPGYWRSLRGPLGPLPFCIAAGGLGLAEVRPWLQAGVDAVALGSSLFDAAAPSAPLRPGLAALLAELGG